MIRSHISCPIIFLTARVEESDKLRGFAAGADDYVVKPFSPSELAARVDEQLEKTLHAALDRATQLLSENREKLDRIARELINREKLDKDRFRRDMGGVEDAYSEVYHRMGLDK